MKAIKVSASTEYYVKIGSGLLKTLGTEVRAACSAGTVAVISDSNVYPIYADVAVKSLTDTGFRVITYVFPAGESSKNGTTYLDILNFLAQNRITRSDCLVALGGGVVGDMAGFVAATYLRGIAYVQVPTTLLAAVDSSVGGKTAIDLPAGKNLAGAFYQPKLVLCDTDTLSTLPEEIFRDGCAEVIKYAILFDEALFSHLKENGLSFSQEDVIARCVELKRDVVMEDEFDTGARMRLNLGHTLGHGIEAKSNFTVSHGKAVSIGIAIITRCARKNCICSEETAKQIEGLLSFFGLPTAFACTAQELFRYALSDKKRSADTIKLIIPEKIGYCRIQSMNVSDILSFIEAGL